MRLQPSCAGYVITSDSTAICIKLASYLDSGIQILWSWGDIQVLLFTGIFLEDKLSGDNEGSQKYGGGVLQLTVECSWSVSASYHWNLIQGGKWLQEGQSASLPTLKIIPVVKTYLYNWLDTSIYTVILHF